LIAGGGLVGLSLALLLSGSGIRVRVVDRMPAELAPAGSDERHLALSEITCRTLESVGALQKLASAAEVIRGIHVSSAGDFGCARWLAADIGLPRFGLVAPAQRLLGALRTATSARSDIHWQASAYVDSVQTDSAGVTAVIVDAQQQRLSIDARLLVIADGTDSALRDGAGIQVDRYDYRAHAICCVVEAERDHAGIAYERFARSGPVAMLPQPGGRCGSIWIASSQDAVALSSLPTREYLAALQRAFGYRLGRLQQAGVRVSYPLRRVYADRLTAERQVLIGNAAQTMHPVGAQGFNLGLRDAAALAENLRASWRSQTDLGEPAALAAYAELRAPDRKITADLSHALALTSTQRSGAASWLRSAAIVLADRVSPLKEHLMLVGIGLRGTASAAARGLQ